MQPSIVGVRKLPARLSVLLLLLGLSDNTLAITANNNSEHDLGELSTLIFAESTPLAPSVQYGFNQQLASELEGAYAYLDLANYFYQLSLDGFGHWFTVQFYEEVNHARMIASFLTARGAEVKMAALPSPTVNKGTPLENFEASLVIEVAQTKRIHALYGLSEAQGQFDASSFLKFFLDEQVQEEDMFQNIVARLRLLAGDPTGLLALDRELAGRALPAPFKKPTMLP